MRVVAAVDLGAESGRVMLGRYDGRSVTLEEAHRFLNGPRAVGGLLRWDLQTLWREIRTGLARAAASLAPGERVDSVGVDAWGVDYGLIDRDGAIIEDPVSYRDPRTEGMLRAAIDKVGRKRLYRATGIQLMEVNTVYQLMAEDPRRLRKAKELLLMPDLFHYLLSGSAVAEYTAATTTGMYDVSVGGWATDLLDDLGIPTWFLPEVVEPGTDLGPLKPDVLEGPAFKGTRVLAPAGHDTASAVVSVPFANETAAYISSGTWSLVGVEAARPILTDKARRANLTNEGGVFSTTRLLRNCMGLWLLQECRRQWRAEGHRYSYDELMELAANAQGGRAVVNPDHPTFVAPGDMPARIRGYCAQTGQPVPEDVPAMVRCVLDSLALRYRMAFDDLSAVTGRPIPEAHIVGGGSRNRMLNRLTADVTGLPVMAGPVEATALGNVLVQLSALGELRGLDEIRAVARASGRPRRIEPRHDATYDELFGRFTEWVAADLTEAGGVG